MLRMIYEFSKFKEQKIGGRGLGGRGRENKYLHVLESQRIKKFQALVEVFKF